MSELNHFSKMYDNIAKPLSTSTSKIYFDDDMFQDNNLEHDDYDDFSLNWDKMDSKVTSRIYLKCKIIFGEIYV